MTQPNYIALIMLCVCFNMQVGFAQLQQSAHWYFGGYAGLNFTSGTPVADLDGQIDYGEGSTSISDEYGNLLFYTDGRKVFDANHTQMPNGSGLWGFPTCTQPALIVPVPGTCHLYYIFTIDVKDTEVPTYRTKKGLAYSVVDMSLNDGLGDIIPNQKNINIPIAGAQQGYERITIVTHSGNTGYWLLTHFESNFYAFEITVNGINTNAVVSNTPGIFNGLYDGNYYIGNLKASPNGSKLAMAFNRAFCNDGGLSVYDFNTATGMVSNEVVLDDLEEVSGSRNFYGVEFSPNGQLLYASCEIPFCAGGFDLDETIYEILQFDLFDTPIVASESVVSSNPHGHGGLQLGLDDKLYFSQGSSSIAQTTLGRIEDPNTPNTPTVLYDAISLDGRNSGMNLPQFLTHYFRSSFTVNDMETNWSFCAGTPVNFNFCSQGGIIESILWNFGDGYTSTETYPTHTYAQDGTYDVTVTMQVEDQGEFVRHLEVEIIAQPTIDAIDAPEACYGTTTEITVTTTAGTVEWYDGVEITHPVFIGNPFTTPELTEATTWYIVLDDGTCRSNPQAVTVNVATEPVLITSDTLICRGDSANLALSISGGKPPFTYFWSNGTTDPTTTVYPYNTTTYQVSAIDACENETESAAIVTISPVKAQFSYEVETVMDVDFTNHSIPKRAIESEWTFGDGTTTNELHPWHRYPDYAEYWVTLTVTDTNGCVHATEKLVIPPPQVYIPNAFSPNEDGINDLFKVVAADAKEVELWIFDRWGQQLHHQAGREVSWNGSNNADGYYVQTGVYTYKAIVRLEGAVDVLEYQGVVTVVR